MDVIHAASDIPLKERLGLIEEALVDAVEKRLVADVPVGSFLSGGLDSSLISAVIARRKDDFDTFSIGFKDASYDEVPFFVEQGRGLIFHDTALDFFP